MVNDTGFNNSSHFCGPHLVLNGWIHLIMCLNYALSTDRQRGGLWGSLVGLKDVDRGGRP